jgi:hypothetical protein
VKLLDKPVEGSLSPIDTAYPRFLRTSLISLFVGAFILFVMDTYRWPLLWDGQVMHYINFLMAHGFAPYRQIYDMNLPGAYLIDSWQIHLFGPGDLAWRLYDFFLLGCMTIAMIVITLPYDWLAGLMAGVLFTLFHAAEGPGNSAQRDQIMTVFLLAGYAFLFQAVRKRRSGFLLPFGMCMGLAVSVKPTAAPLALALVLMTLYVLKKARRPLVNDIVYAVAGFLIPASAVLIFLLHHHALGPFLDISKRLTPYYASLMRASRHELLRGSLPISVFAIVPVGLVVGWINRNRVNWEHWAILAGVLFGFTSYLLQDKGYKYHRYPFLAFLLLWLCIEFVQAIRNQGWSRRLGFAGLLFATLVMVPLGVYHIHNLQCSDEYAQTLEADLRNLGGSSLQHKVQCLDMVDGCLSALYRLGLIQNTGFTGDTLFFPPQDAPAVEYYRRVFWDGLQTNPPKVIVMSDEWFNWPRGFDKINHWPQFASYLNSFYTPIQTRTFQDSAYRIYLRKE